LIDFIQKFLPLWQESIAGVNLPVTLLFGTILAFWLLNIIGVLGTELLDFLIPMDFGAIDIPILSGDTLTGIFDFFYIGKVPLVILISVFGFALWPICILSNYYLNPEKTWGIGLMVLGIGWIASIFAMKLSLMPFEKLFESIESLDILDTPEAFIGKICTIKSPRADQKFGQAEIENPNGAPFLFNVKPTRESEVLKRGESAVIVDTSDKVFNIKKINI
tara:strand:+ start:446 stop:1105 length:660 start_codon:yes stop_codon:yes gene_type:complete